MLFSTLTSLFLLSLSAAGHLETDQLDARELRVPARTVLLLSPVLDIRPKTHRRGERVDFRLHQEVLLSDGSRIPKGTPVLGRIIRSRRPGRLVRRARLVLEVTEIVWRGQAYSLRAEPVRMKGGSTLLKKFLASGATSALMGAGTGVGGVMSAYTVFTRGPGLVLRRDSVVPVRLVEDLRIPVR